MCFAKKHNKKGLKKIQADNTKAVSTCAAAIKALVKPQAIKPKMPKSPSSKLSCLAFVTHPRLGKWIRSYMAKGIGSARQSPRLKPRRRPKLQLRPRLQLQLSSQRCPGLCEGPIEKAPVSVKTDGLL
ncbi:60S ribosomal protein L29-like [Apodemus sylvaticus]|uniref:60S ribosomal protein L29-like n=1 Tax=Apodemus sylvaticus TaxID=10129 RepID=UPI0022440154|nr:60S ribosomal protein L29-like [Apodemus sylvaticus]